MAYSTKTPDVDDDNKNNILVTCWSNSTIVIKDLSGYLTNIKL